MPGVTLAVRYPSLITSDTPKRADTAKSEHDSRLARACAAGDSDAFAELRTAESLNVKVTRRGQPVSIDFKIQ